eukprot:920371_1
MSYHRVPRAAALKAQQRVKDIQDEKNSIRRIHQGEIRLSEYAYVNHDADPLIGDNNKGAVLIASPPMLDSNNDYGIDCIFANDHSITICIIHAHNSPTSTIPSNISQYYPSDTKDAPTPAPISTPENIPENAPIPTPQPKTPFISIPTPTVIPSGYSLYGAIGSGDSLYGSGDSFYTLQKLKIGSEISLYGSGDSLLVKYHYMVVVIHYVVQLVVVIHYMVQLVVVIHYMLQLVVVIHYMVQLVVVIHYMLQLVVVIHYMVQL